MTACLIVILSVKFIYEYPVFHSMSYPSSTSNAINVKCQN